MRRAARSEPERARKKVLLVHELQHHDNHPLTYLVLEGWHVRIELHFDPASLWDRLRLLTRFTRSVAKSLLS
jgi:hypothetical protein